MFQTRLIDKRLGLLAEKDTLVQALSRDIRKKAFFSLSHHFNALRKLVTTEKKINQHLLQNIQKPPFLERYALGLVKNETLKNEIENTRRIVNKLAEALAKTHEQVLSQHAFLHKASLLRLHLQPSSFEEFKKLFLGFKNSYLHEQDAQRKIILFSKKEYHVLKKRLEELEREKEVFRAHKKLIHDIFQTYRKLIAVIGNEPQFAFYSSKIEKLIARAKKTNLYAYMKSDFAAITSKAEHIQKHPKKSKLAYIALTAYILVPTTFELTFLILFLRYSTKLFLDFSKQKLFK